MEPIRMTDKAQTKVLPCSFPGCGVPLIVNLFESAARARCPEHKGKSSWRADNGDGSPPPLVGTPSDALRRLLCPFHEEEVELTLIQWSKEGEKMSLACPECKAVVSFLFRFSPLLIPSMPEELRPLADAFNNSRGGRSVAGRWR